MNPQKRIIIAMMILLLFVGAVLGVDYLQRKKAATQMPVDVPPGSIPIFVGGKFLASFRPDDLDQLESASFVDDEEGKTQEGWLLRDVLLLYLDGESLQAESRIKVSSSSREKDHTLTWGEVENLENMVIFDLSGRGTLKLVSTIPGFDIRDAWIQDVDKIEVIHP
jgi:hypothetical protein